MKVWIYNTPLSTARQYRSQSLRVSCTFAGRNCEEVCGETRENSRLTLRRTSVHLLTVGTEGGVRLLGLGMVSTSRRRWSFQFPEWRSTIYGTGRGRMKWLLKIWEKLSTSRTGKQASKQFRFFRQLRQTRFFDLSCMTFPSSLLSFSLCFTRSRSFSLLVFRLAYTVFASASQSNLFASFKTSWKPARTRVFGTKTRFFFLSFTSSPRFLLFSNSSFVKIYLPVSLYRTSR